jgi:tetratricopeptide (TPR) repeat protein
MKQNSILRNITRICLTGIFLFISSYSFSQDKTLLSTARNFVVNEQIAQAVSCYAQLANKDKINSALLTEYAYVLALNGVYEGALMNIDRARLFGNLSDKCYFYIVQVFSLMGYDWITIEYVKKSSVPEWIASHYERFHYKHKQKVIIHSENLDVAFKRANYLAASGLCFQSIVLYEQLLEEQPDNYLFHIGYSISLEKVGLLKLAIDEMETGISLMDNTPETKEARQVFADRIAELKQKQNAEPPKQTWFLDQWSKLQAFNPKTMLYAGGMFSSSYTAFNSRFGVYLSNSFNASLGLGISGNSDATYFNLGISGYQRFGKTLVLGLGINEQTGGGTGVFSIKPSVGLSFVNNRRDASWDLFFDIYCPLKKDAKTMFGVSIGRSFYFGNR